MRNQALRTICAIALIAGTVSAGSASAGEGDDHEHHINKNEIRFDLAPSSPAIASCLPRLEAQVEVDLQTAQNGRDQFEISASGLPPKQDFTVFLLQVPGTPFGAAEYIGDFGTKDDGNGENTFKLIVQEAFSSTVVAGSRVRVDLNRVGVWFADPADDDFCLGPGAGPVTPFDGDGAAGVQAFNSANADPLPAP